MLLFQIGKDTLNRFFPLGVDVSVPRRMPQMFCFIQGILPNMAKDELLVIPILCALGEQWARLTNPRVGDIFTISLSIRCSVRKHLVLGTKKTIVVFIIDKLVFPDIAFRGHRAFIWHDGMNAFFLKFFGNGRRFIPRIHRDNLWLAHFRFQLIKQFVENLTIVDIRRFYQLSGSVVLSLTSLDGSFCEGGKGFFPFFTLFKHITVPETTNVVLPKRRKVGDLILKAKS